MERLSPPKISVLVPAYNAAPYLRVMVGSVVRQTFTNWELIIVDDGSDDSTQAVLTTLLLEYNNWNIGVMTCTHQGCSAALKIAISVSSAPLCTFVGADDLLPPNSLQDIVEAFDSHPEVGFLWTRYHKKMEGGKNWTEGRSKRLPKGKSLKEALLSGWWGALAQDCWRRSAYERTPGLDPKISYVVDQQLAMLFANLGCKVMHLPKVTYYHLQHRKQMSATHCKEQQRCRASVLERLGGKYVREL